MDKIKRLCEIFEDQSKLIDELHEKLQQSIDKNNKIIELIRGCLDRDPSLQKILEAIEDL